MFLVPSDGQVEVVWLPPENSVIKELIILPSLIMLNSRSDTSSQTEMTFYTIETILPKVICEGKI